MAKPIIQKYRKIFFVFLCCIVVVTLLMAPFASNEYLRSPPSDFIQHVLITAEAKTSLSQGQFPLRTGSWGQNITGLAWFQFYAPAFSTFSAIVHNFFFPDNPYVALKYVIWLCLLFGIFFFYLFILQITNSSIIAFISALVYIMNPYLLINIFERGAITEACAQGMLPVLLFLNFRLLFSENFSLITIFFTSIAWFFLAGTHLITFAYFSLFFALFLCVFFIFHRKSLQNILVIGFAYLYGVLLGLYYWIPLKMVVNNLFVNYFGKVSILRGFGHLTPLSTLFSIAPTTPIPLLNPYLLLSPKMYLSVGLPILLGVIGTIYLFITRKCDINRELKLITKIFLGLFFCVFFCAWTPFDFWLFVPKILQIAQFNYRFLSHVSWIGSILFAISIFVFTKNKLEIRHAIIGMMLIFLCTKSWVTFRPLGYTLASYSNNGKATYAKEYSVFFSKLSKESFSPVFDYVLPAQSVNALKSSNTPIASPIEKATQNCLNKNNKTFCNITNSTDKSMIVQLPMFYYPNMLSVSLNGNQISYFPIEHLIEHYLGNFPAALTAVIIPPGQYQIEAEFRGIVWANYVSMTAWIIAISLILLMLIQHCLNTYSKYNAQTRLKDAMV